MSSTIERVVVGNNQPKPVANDLNTKGDGLSLNEVKFLELSKAPNENLLGLTELLTTYSVEVVAKILHCHEQRVLELAQQGRLPGAKIGKAWIFRPVDVANFLQKQILEQTTHRAKSLVPIAGTKHQTLIPAPKRVRNKLPSCTW